jgi:hypothetical protein
MGHRTHRTHTVVSPRLNNGVHVRGSAGTAFSADRPARRHRQSAPVGRGRLPGDQGTGNCKHPVKPHRARTPNRPGQNCAATLSTGTGHYLNGVTATITKNSVGEIAVAVIGISVRTLIPLVQHLSANLKLLAEEVIRDGSTSLRVASPPLSPVRTSRQLPASPLWPNLSAEVQTQIARTLAVLMRRMRPPCDGGRHHFGLPRNSSGIRPCKVGRRSCGSVRER